MSSDSIEEPFEWIETPIEIIISKKQVEECEDKLVVSINDQKSVIYI